jgi:hypothetical protein
MAPTKFAAEVAQSRAILEIAAGRIDGPGLQFVRAYVGAVDEGRISDPSQPRQVPAKPKAPFQHLPITNDVLDGRQREDYKGPTRGSAAWFAALKKQVKS